MAVDRREYMREYQRQWLANRRAEFFGDKSCVRCGAIDNLELDHVDPTEKVSNHIWSWSLARREAEIAKCQILCAECHKQKTISQLPITHGYLAYRHGTSSMYKNQGCRCGLCKLWYRNYWRDYRARDVA